MLPKAARLRKEREFRAAFARGRSYKGDLIVMYVLPRQGDAVRFGFTTAKKIGGAVERNRLKRLLREASRRLISRVKPGTDIVIIARVHAAGASLERLLSEMERHLSKSGVFIDKKD